MGHDVPRRLARVLRDPVALRRALRRRLRGQPAQPTQADVAAPAPSHDPHAADELIEGRLSRLLGAPHVDVIVPVGQDARAALSTLRAVLRWSDEAASILVVGPDATDVVARTAPGVNDPPHAIEAESQVAAVRAAIARTSGDLAFVVPGSEVGPGWIRGLRRAAHALPRGGMATALSDLRHPAGAVGDGSLPAGLEVADLARAIARRPRSDRVATAPLALAPAGYVRRAMLRGVEVRGLGDTSDALAILADLGLQAARRGWLQVVDGATWVHVPAGSALRRHPLHRPDGPEVRSREHPDLVDRWRALADDHVLAEIVAEAGRRWLGAARTTSRPRPRVLYVLHEGEGGTPGTAWDLARHVASETEPFVLTSDTKTLKLSELDAGGEPRLIEEFALPEPLVFLSPSDRAYRATLASILDGLAIETVHIRHVYRHTLDLPEVASALGCRVLLSLHDSYLICPTIHLLDDRGRFCGGVCTPGVGRCMVGPLWLRPAADDLKHGYVHEWRRLVGAMLTHVDRIVTTSDSMRQLFLTAYPQLATPIDIIEHGRDLDPRAPTTRVAGGALDRPLRVLVPGFMAFHKGGEVIREVAALDVDDDVEFHFLGHVEKAFQDLGVQHGRYEREDFERRVAAIEPDVAAILSICAESYCHTLTESWAAGLPVVGTALGAVGERIARDGGGWLVDVDDPASILGLLRELRQDPDGIRREASRIDPARFIPADEMAADYLDLYLPHPAAPPRVVVIHGEAGGGRLEAALREASTAVRIINVPAQQTSLVAARASGYGLVAIAEEAVIPEEAADALASACKRHEVPILLERGTATQPDRSEPLGEFATLVGASEDLLDVVVGLLGSREPSIDA